MKYVLISTWVILMLHALLYEYAYKVGLYGNYYIDRDKAWRSGPAIWVWHNDEIVYSYYKWEAPINIADSLLCVSEFELAQEYVKHHQ